MPAQQSIVLKEITFENSMIKAKKSLGQNFLKDDSVVKRIVDAAKITFEDVVVEIGPGKGVMTQQLAGRAKKVIAIELDDRLIPVLEEKFANQGNVEIVQGDILKINLPKLIEDAQIANNKYKVVANIPYYITGPIVRLLLETRHPASEIILMVQKEVAERICAKPGDMSILAVAVQYYANAEMLFGVPKTAFDPEPQVDSAIIKIVYNAEKSIGHEEAKKFFRIVKAGFSAKRKTLANNLSNSLHIKKGEVEEILEKSGFSKSIRAQELSVAHWEALTEVF